MSWLTPWGLLGLVSVPVVVALSLWRWRRRQVAVSSLLLWRQVAAEWHGAPKAQRRRRLDPLVVLRVAVALVLVAAVCGPVWVSVREGGRHLVIVADRSASMAMRRPDGRTRWEACRDALMGLVARLGPNDRVAVIGLPGSIHGGAPAAAADLLRTLEPTDVPVAKQDLMDAATRALRLLGGASVATDDVLEGLPAGARVLATGGAAANRGIVAFAARKRRDGQHEVLVAIANAAAQAASVDVVLLGDDKELGRRRVAVPARGGRGQAVFEAALATVAVLEARLVGEDALAADNRAWLARRTRPVRVAWVGESNYALRRALAVQPAVEILEAAGGALPGDCDLAIYYRTVPEGLGQGRVVVVAPRGPVGALRPGGEVETGECVVAAPRDPLMAAVTLASVKAGRVARVTVPEGFEALARAGDVPLIGRWRQGEASALYVGIDPARSNWPLDPSFPIFWANVVARAAGGGAGGDFASARPGDVCRVAPEGESASVRMPGGSSVEAVSGVFRPQRVGLYRVQRRDGGGRTVAVSLLSEGETTAVGSEAGLPPGVLADAAGGTPAASTLRLSGWLAALGLVLVALHGWVARGGRRT